MLIISIKYTGYYTERSPDEAQDYCKRKMEWVQKQIDQVRSALVSKTQAKEAVMREIQAKLQTQQEVP